MFKIGAVSRITNIPVDTLRIWERRYSVVVPFRSENSDRLYSTEDIKRLNLLKMLVGRGHTIGTVARLENEKLIERLEIHDANTVSKDIPNDPDKAVHVAVVGDVLPLQIQHTQINNSAFMFSGLYRSEADFYENHQDDKLDVLIIEYPAIQEDHLEKIHNLFKSSGAKKLILIYGFTNSAAKTLLNETEYTYIQAPVTIDHLQSEILHVIEKNKLHNSPSESFDLNGKAPLRNYTNNELIKLSSASATIKCECPQHLSSMILKLVQFEVYSAECVSRYKKDADLHALLGNMTGHARSIMEQALTKVIEAEGISVK
jgi:hypothetical protein